MKASSRIRVRQSPASRFRPWIWRVFCPECGHDAFVPGTVQDAYHRAATMAVDHIPGGMSCAFDAAYAFWRRHAKD